MNLKDRSNYKILVVDDTPALLDISVRMLETAGFKVITAIDGSSCLAVLEKEIPDIILLDVILPDINGKDLCKRIKTNPEYSSIFIFLLSSLEKSADKISEGLEDGAEGYIPRPVSNRELIARVDAACRIINTERKLRASLDELARINNLFFDREIKMVELKKEINDLLLKNGKKEKYKIFSNKEDK